MEVECPDWVASLSKVALRQINPMIPNFSDYTFAFTSYNDKYGLVWNYFDPTFVLNSGYDYVIPKPLDGK